MTIRDMNCTKCFNISPFCSMYFFQYKCKHFTKYATIHWKCQSSCYKSTKRCVQTVKLNSLKEICVFIWVLKELLLQIHSPYLSCFGYARLLRRQLRSHNRITSCFTSLQYNIRYQNNLSLVGISRSNSFIFSLHSLSLTLSLSLSLFSNLYA